MIDRNDLRQLEKAMTRAVFRGAFWAILLTSIVAGTASAILVMIVLSTYPSAFDRLAGSADETDYIAEAREWEQLPDQDKALRMAQQFVRENGLKAPATAQWPELSELGSYATELGNGRYKVVSWVDAQNTFGAMIRIDYEAVLRHIGIDDDFSPIDSFVGLVSDPVAGLWEVESLDLDE